MDKGDVSRTLCGLGLLPSSVCYFYMAEALRLSLREPDRLLPPMQQAPRLRTLLLIPSAVRRTPMPQPPARPNSTIPLVTKHVYPDVARCFDTNWKCVERGLRRAANVAWNTAPEKLSELAHRHLTEKPSVSELLSLLTIYLRAEEEN